MFIVLRKENDRLVEVARTDKKESAEDIRDSLSRGRWTIYVVKELFNDD